MNAGKLRDQITIQTPTLVQQANGQALTTWTTYATRLAKVTTPSVSQFLASSREVKQGADPRTMRQNRWFVKLRHDPDLASSMRVRWLDHTLDIEGITADPENASYMFLHCLETVPSTQGFGDLAAAPAMVVKIGATEYDSGDTYAFGAVGIGHSTFTVSLSNATGTAALAIAVPVTVTDANSYLSASSGPAEITIPAAATAIEMTYDWESMVTAGMYSAVLTIESNDPTAPMFTLTITCTVA